MSLAVGFSYAAAKQDGQQGFHQAMTIDPNDDDRKMTRQLLFLFRQNWTGQTVRNLAVYTSQLVPNTGQQLTLFTDLQRQIKAERLNGGIDEVHQQFGFSKLVFATSLIQGGTAIERSQLVDGHNGGIAMPSDLKLIIERLKRLFNPRSQTRYWLQVVNDRYDQCFNFFFNSQRQPFEQP